MLDIKQSYFDAVLTNIKNDRNLAYAVSLDALYKWKEQSQQILLEYLKNQTALSIEKLEGITEALIEFSINNSLENNLLRQLRVKIDSRIYDDTDGSNLMWINNVLSLFKSQTRLEFNLKWIVTSLLGNSKMPISDIYIEPLLDLLGYYINSEKLDADTKFDVILSAKNIKFDLLRAIDLDKLVELKITILRILRKKLPVTLYPRFILLKMRYFLRAVLDFGSVYDILGLIAIIVGPLSARLFSDSAILPAIIVVIGLIIAFLFKYNIAKRKKESFHKTVNRP